jgi:small-conductance mechanosensitive channel
MSIFDEILKPETLAGAIFYALVFFVLALVISFVGRKLLQRLFDRGKRPWVDRTAMTFMMQFIQVMIFVFASIWYFSLIPALRNIGTAILATAGVASIVLGLAAQSTLGNIISGISILMYRPVRLGDMVKVYASAGEETGVVESISLGYTTLSMSSGEKIIVPNSVLASTVIVNYGEQKEE